MNGLVSYSASDSDDDGSASRKPFKMLSASIVTPDHLGLSLNATPNVLLPIDSQRNVYLNPTASSLPVNLTYNEMYAPTYGPQNPLSKPIVAPGQKNLLTGYVKEDGILNGTFSREYHAFSSHGRAADPSISANQASVVVARDSDARTIGKCTLRKAEVMGKRKRMKGDADPSSENYLGPWAAYEGEGVGEEGVAGAPLTEAEQVIRDAAIKARATKLAERAAKAGDAAAGAAGGRVDRIPVSTVEETSIFHGKAEFDYAGRSWLSEPKGIDRAPEDPTSVHSYMPTKCLHTWTGHSKGVNACRWFPSTGHMMLSASMDSKVKIWDVFNDRRCMRTYLGHAQAVRDICFSNDGRRFLSSSYDKFLKLWDTETGACLGSFTTGAVAYCVKMNPDDDKQHEFLAACSDKKIVQWDSRANQVVQEYTEHLGPVNTITFIDNNNKFVSTSDDKKVLIWEYGLPVVAKHIAEPYLHSMPSVSLTPDGKFLLGQSMDDQILVFETGGRFRRSKKKFFSGHLVAGYACEVGASLSGRFVSSGTSEGQVWFWDFKTCRVLSRLRCHDQVVMTHSWHPARGNMMMTGSWDGTCKLWSS